MKRSYVIRFPGVGSGDVYYSGDPESPYRDFKGAKEYETDVDATNEFSSAVDESKTYADLLRFIEFELVKITVIGWR